MPVRIDRTEYWDSFYEHERRSRSSQRRPLPSEFAAFVAGELEEEHDVVELGCGGGRDSLFLSSYGHSVTGVDASAEAVSACRELAETFRSTAKFVHAAVTDARLPHLLTLTTSPRLVYARFLVHAIDDSEEQDFLDLAAQLTRSGDLLAGGVPHRQRPQWREGDRSPLPAGYVLPAQLQSAALKEASASGTTRGLRFRQVPSR